MSYQALIKNPIGNIPENVASVTPNDSTDISYDACLYIGTGGDVKLTAADGTTVTFSNVPSGTFMPVAARRIWSTGTTASDIVALW